VLVVAELAGVELGDAAAELVDRELELPHAVTASARTLRTAIRVTRYLTAIFTVPRCAGAGHLARRCF
jgi:hypothetical protein